MVSRYGYVKNFSAPEHQTQVANTSQCKYGVEYAVQSEAIKDKIRQAHENKFGKWFTKTPEYTEHRIQTCMDKYQASHWMKADQYRAAVGDRSRKRSVEVDGSIQSDYTAGLPKQLLAQKYDFSISHMQKILQDLGLATDLPQNKINYHHNWRSAPEQELVNLIKQNYDGQMICNDRKLIWPMEIDIVLPDKKIAIEFNGTYWHSDHFKHRNFHLQKLEQMEQQGFHLIQIFSCFWTGAYKDVMQQKIRSLFDQKYLGARHCTIERCDYAAVKDFQEKHHIQGARTTSLNWAVYHQGQMVACATFNRFRDGVELVRYCSNVRIVGILQKILQRLPAGVPVYSFANRLYTKRSENLYVRSGFQEIDMTSPGYYYVKGTRVITRNSAMKHRLPGLLGENFNKELSEYDNMVANGFHRIWDCGHILYRYEGHQ